MLQIERNGALFGVHGLAGCGKTRFDADAVPRNSLVSTAQPDKKKVCAEKTSNSWTCSATSVPSSEFRTKIGQVTAAMRLPELQESCTESNGGNLESVSY